MKISLKVQAFVWIKSNTLNSKTKIQYIEKCLMKWREIFNISNLMKKVAIILVRENYTWFERLCKHMPKFLINKETFWYLQDKDRQKKMENISKMQIFPNLLADSQKNFLKIYFLTEILPNITDISWKNQTVCSNYYAKEVVKKSTVLL